ncbi:DNA-deoxyinosine glycosylase [Chitinivorax sp. PXF-14]|uniref:DNA-deoxyinosine glycosylase n=1 Tax=Chitinivorax sp. PXF-14 TaxID=3230488 RepID=UPI003466B87E
MTGEAARKRSFPPVIGPDTRLLILGSLPGDASLAAGQYYAHRQNRFWELVGSVIDTDLRTLPYDARLASLLHHGIGLWDVIAEAERAGSLDAAIRNETHNPLQALLMQLPSLQAIAFNGGTAARLGRRQLREAGHRLALIDLPSSSPAHTLAYPQKQQRWLALQVHLPAIGAGRTISAASAPPHSPR